MDIYRNFIARLAVTATTFRRDERGQTMTEYALLIALVAIVLIAVIEVLTGAISDVFKEAGTELKNAGSP